MEPFKKVLKPPPKTRSASRRSKMRRDDAVGASDDGSVGSDASAGGEVALALDLSQRSVSAASSFVKYLRSVPSAVARARIMIQQSRKRQ